MLLFSTLVFEDPLKDWHISKLWEQNYNLQEEGTTGQGAGSGGIRLILSTLPWCFLMTLFKLKICAISDSYKQPGIPDSFLPERGVSGVSSIWGRWHFLHLRGGLGGISYISYIASVPSHFCNKMELNPNWLEHVSSLSLLFIPSCVTQLVCNVLVYMITNTKLSTYWNIWVHDSVWQMMNLVMMMIMAPVVVMTMNRKGLNSDQGTIRSSISVHGGDWTGSGRTIKT